jgi:hypothetical protein
MSASDPKRTSALAPSAALDRTACSDDFLGGVVELVTLADRQALDS